MLEAAKEIKRSLDEKIKDLIFSRDYHLNCIESLDSEISHWEKTLEPLDDYVIKNSPEPEPEPEPESEELDPRFEPE